MGQRETPILKAIGLLENPRVPQTRYSPSVSPLQRACGDQLDQFFSNLGAHRNSLGCFKKIHISTFHLENLT